MRIGHGYDVHRLTEGDGIVLGGVFIAFDKALIAHSDGDVVLHALCDALLGAAGLGDIGRHFPDTDKTYKNCDSRFLLKQVYHLVIQQGFELVNLDITIIAQAPKMAPHISDMIANISQDLNSINNSSKPEMAANAVNIKATTTEGLGYIGREEGIAVHAVVLLRVIARP